MKRITFLAMFIALVSTISIQADKIVINRMHIWKDGVSTNYLVESDLDSITFSQEIIIDDESNHPIVEAPEEGKTTIVLYVPEDTPAGCYAVGTVNDWNIQDTEWIFTPVAGATNPRWVACTFDYVPDMQLKVIAFPSDLAVAPSWSYQWGPNAAEYNTVEEDNVVILEGEGLIVLENWGEPMLMNLADGGVCYIQVKAWAKSPIVETEPCQTAAFKHPWGGDVWSYREATKTAEATFELNALYGNSGVNVALDVTGAGEYWYPIEQLEFVGDVAEGDSVNFKFVSEKGTIGRMVVTLIEKKGPSTDDSEEVESITVKAKVPDFWTDVITAWVWPTGGEGEEVYPTKEGDWYVYTCECDELNIIFKNGYGWTGDAYQTVDITMNNSLTCLELWSDGVSKATYTIVDCEGTTEGSYDYLLNDFEIGGYDLFHLENPIAGTDTVIEISIGEVTVQLAPALYYVWDKGIVLSGNSLAGAGYIMAIEAYTYVITKGDYAGYYVDNGALFVDAIDDEDMIPYTATAGKLLDVNMYGDAWVGLLSYESDEEIEHAYELYNASQTGTQFFYIDFETGAQSFYYGNVSNLYLTEDSETGELYYDLKLEWYDHVSPNRFFGLLVETEMDENGEESINSIIEPYDMRLINKQYQVLPPAEEAPARVQGKAKPAQYTISNQKLSLERISQLPSLKKINKAIR